MMSSVIPARLTFQCGHAALVTLPRVKGETASQRNERVAFEKSAALARQCDFCGPSVEVAAPTLLSDVIATHATTADLLAAEPVVAAAPESQPVVAAATEAEPVAAVPEPNAVETTPEPTSVETTPEPEPVAEVPEPAPAVAAQSQPHVNGVVKRAPVRRRPATGRAFVIEYRVERLVKAADIHDAMRLAATLGAADIVSITRED